MLNKRNVLVVLTGLLFVAVSIPFVIAAEDDQQMPPPLPPVQGPGGPGGPDGGQMRGQGQGRGGADFQARMMDLAKTELAASDESWTKIEPLLVKVVTLNNQVSSRGGVRSGRQGQGQGQPPAAPQGEQSEVQKASMALRALTQDKTSSMDQIKEKLAELRTAKEKAKDELAKAQKELKKNLDTRQEAKLVLLGILN